MHYERAVGPLSFLLFCFLSLSVPSIGTPEVKAQDAPPGFLCKPPWLVGDKTTYFATMHIAQAGGIGFDYVRVEMLAHKGSVEWPHDAESFPRQASLVRRLQLTPATSRRSTHAGLTNFAVPRPYEQLHFVDVYRDNNVWAGTIRASSAQQDLGDLSAGKLLSSMTTYDLLWPITPMRRVVKTFEYRDLTIEVRKDLVDLGHPFGKLPALLVDDEFSYRGSRWGRKTWYSPEFPVAVKREWQWPGREQRLELIGFEPAPGAGVKRDAPCHVPVEMNLPSIGSIIVRAGLTRTRPARPPDGSTDVFSPDDAVYGYVVFDPEQIPVGAAVTARARWLREDQEIHVFSGRLQLEPRWVWFWWVSSLPKEKTQPGSYTLEWSLDGTVVDKIPFVVRQP